MKRFIKTNKKFNLKKPQKGIIITSCLDNRSEIFLEFCRQHNKLTQSKSLALFTNRRIFNENKNESRYFQSILIDTKPILYEALKDSRLNSNRSWTSSTPGLALLSGMHEIQYSRLFRS